MLVIGYYPVFPRLLRTYALHTRLFYFGLPLRARWFTDTRLVWLRLVQTFLRIARLRVYVCSLRSRFPFAVYGLVGYMHGWLLRTVTRGLVGLHLRGFCRTFWFVTTRWFTRWLRLVG